MVQYANSLVYLRENPDGMTLLEMDNMNAIDNMITNMNDDTKFNDGTDNKFGVVFRNTLDNEYLSR